MIDAYDVLNLSFDADEEEIKKAYRRMSLQHHPDKVRASGSSCEEANAKFNEIKIARDILVDPDRRKIHDTFGIDLGEEKPELEVWTIGVGSMLSPMGTFALKTFVMRAVIWTMGWRYIGYLVLLLGMVVALLYAIDFKFREVKVRSQDGLPYVIGAGIAVGVVAIVWIWQLLADAAGIFYLASEVVDLALFVENWKIGLGAAITSFFVAWLVRGWWFWIIVLQVALVVVVLIAVSMASELVRLWIENVKTQHGDKLKDWRLRMRKQRKTLQDEVAELKNKMQDCERVGNGYAVDNTARRPVR
mmetsp:Transcript_49263/g.141403  ORF Transcript_49263/g.141403 Transcript_49263/m.141403 type:complete len:303 (+) Transcript_49263:73-981(+)